MAKLKEYIRSTDRKNDAPTIQSLSDTINLSKELIPSLERLSANEALLKKALQGVVDYLDGTKKQKIQEPLVKNNGRRWWIIPLWGGTCEEARNHFNSKGNYAHEFNLSYCTTTCFDPKGVDFEYANNIESLTATQVGFILEILISKEVPISLEGYK